MALLVNFVMWAVSVFLVGGSLFGWCFFVFWWRSDRSHKRRVQED